MIQKLIRCTACNRVVPNYEGYDLIRGREFPDLEWSNEELAGAKEFLISHSGHELEELSVQIDSLISEKPAYEPIRESYFYADNGDRTFLIHRKKPTLDQPACYEIIPGKLRIAYVSLHIQEEDLQREIAGAKEISGRMKEKMPKFVQAFRDEVRGISAEAFEGEAEKIEEGETSLVSYGSLNESRWARILNRCRVSFQLHEMQALQRFVEENKNPPDTLSIIIRRRFSIISLVGAEPGMALQDAEMVKSESLAPAVVEKRASKKNP